jgi:hypothetical protein
MRSPLPLNLCRNILSVYIRTGILDFLLTLMVSAFLIIEQFPLLVITNLSEMSSALGGVSLHPSQDDKSMMESYTCEFSNDKLLMPV